MTTNTVGQLAELDRFKAALRDLSAFVLGVHHHAAHGAQRVAYTWNLAGVDVLIGHDHDAPDKLVMIIEGNQRHVYELDAQDLGATLPGEPEHFDGGQALVERALAELAL